jgi:cell division control protein 7
MQRTEGFTRRLGTRGFLAPEIIFNARIQTKAVDIWAAGIVLLSFLTQRMPVLNLNKFSKIKETNIKEILPLILIFGPEKIVETARAYNVYLFIPDTIKQYQLENGFRTMIVKEGVDDIAYDLLTRMLELDASKRITAEDAKKHDFFKDLL